jgi:hypothetical protein
MSTESVFEFADVRGILAEELPLMSDWLKILRYLVNYGTAEENESGNSYEEVLRYVLIHSLKLPPFYRVFTIESSQFLLRNPGSGCFIALVINYKERRLIGRTEDNGRRIFDILKFAKVLIVDSQSEFFKVIPKEDMHKYLEDVHLVYTSGGQGGSLLMGKMRVVGREFIQIDPTIKPLIQSGTITGISIIRPHNGNKRTNDNLREDERVIDWLNTLPPLKSLIVSPHPPDLFSRIDVSKLEIIGIRATYEDISEKEMAQLGTAPLKWFFKSNPTSIEQSQEEMRVILEHLPQSLEGLYLEGFGCYDGRSSQARNIKRLLRLSNLVHLGLRNPWIEHHLFTREELQEVFARLKTFKIHADEHGGDLDGENLFILSAATNSVDLFFEGDLQVIIQILKSNSRIINPTNQLQIVF